MLPGDGKPLRCPWIDESVTILSDGTVTCGLDDSDGLRSFGNIHHQSLREIFANPEYERLREGLRKGMRCADCSLYQPLKGELAPRPALPDTLIVEPTIRCNLRCPQIACHANNSRDHQTRDSEDLPRDVLEKCLDEIGDRLKQVYFFNYGDPFMHREATGMLADIRKRNPNAYIITSTNGIPLAPAKKAREIVAAKLNHIVFTISGMTQESYSRYHINGRLETALLGLKRVVEARREAGVSWPHITWRYLAFRWCDNDEEIEAALALAQELGVDEFSLYLTHIPEDGWSYRLAEGTPGHARYRRWLTPAYGYSAPKAPPNGLYPVEDLPLFGKIRWTNWRAKISAKIIDGEMRLYLSTNSPAAAEAGYVEVYLRTSWRRGYRIRVPYCRWGEIRLPVPTSLHRKAADLVEVICPDSWFPRDWFGVDDYRCLGVMTWDSLNGGGTIGHESVRLHPASPKELSDLLRTRNGGSLTPVASAQTMRVKSAALLKEKV